MSRSLIGALVAVVAGAALTTAAIPAHADTMAFARASAGDLSTDIDAILSDGRLQGATVSVIVRDAASGAVLYDRGADTREIPASNNKIETSTAAFGILGAGYRFGTGVYKRSGTLYLKGTGDPTMRAADYDTLAAAVRKKGIKKLTGGLVADDRWFDEKFTPAGWDPSDLPYSYAAGISALNVAEDAVFDVNALGVTIKPGALGKPVKVTLSPPTGVVKIDNRAKTGKSGSASTISVDRTNGTNTIVITGSYPVNGTKENHLSTVLNPTLYAADVFRRALKAHGVTVIGKTKVGSTPRSAKGVTSHRSIPLSQIAPPYLKLSNNQISEIMTKAIGRKVSGKGTTAAGVAATAAYLKTLGVDTTQVKQTDGSGLSRTNQSTTRQLTNVLKAARTKSWFSTWYNALPIAGKPGQLVGGTLASRMTGTAAAGNVHAKTGTLTGVTALSGYVTDPSGTPLIFSIIFNGYKGGAPKDIEDKIAIRLASGKNPAQTMTATRMARNGGSLECSWTRTC